MRGVYPAKGVFPLAIFLARNDLFPLSSLDLVTWYDVVPMPAKEKCRFVRKKSLVETHICITETLCIVMYNLSTMMYVNSCIIGIYSKTQ